VGFPGGSAHGIRTPGFGGLYYQAGIDLSDIFDTYYGSLNANAAWRWDTSG